MKKGDDADWEVVDSMPGEKKPSSDSKKKALYLKPSLWIGIGIGLIAALAFPPTAILIRKLYSLWWLAAIWGGYYLMKRLRKKGG